MTEDELIFALAEADQDLDAAIAKMESAQETVGKIERFVSAQKQLLHTLECNLAEMISAPVISLREFATLKKNVTKAREDLLLMQTKRQEAQKLFTIIKTEVDRLNTRCRQLEQQLEDQPQVVLEFKRRE